MEKFVPNADRETICGPLAALLAMTSVPIWLPGTVGVNVTVIVQLPPPGTLVPQLLLAANSLLALIEILTSVPLPLVVSVMDCPGLVLPTT